MGEQQSPESIRGCIPRVCERGNPSSLAESLRVVMASSLPHPRQTRCLHHKHRRVFALVPHYQSPAPRLEVLRCFHRLECGNSLKPRGLSEISRWCQPPVSDRNRRKPRQGREKHDFNVLLNGGESPRPRRGEYGFIRNRWLTPPRWRRGIRVVGEVGEQANFQ